LGKEEIEMKGLKTKFKKQGGFTLIEMLIVVAIIAILIAVSIPIVNNALESARHATDASNERSAKAEIVIQYLLGEDGKPKIDTKNGVYYYDAKAGVLKESPEGIKVYGQHEDVDHTGCIIALKINTAGTVSMAWVSGKTEASKINDGKLCSTVLDANHTSAGTIGSGGGTGGEGGD